MTEHQSKQSDEVSSSAEITNNNDLVAGYYKRFLRKKFPDLNEDEVQAKASVDLQLEILVSLVKHAIYVDTEMKKTNPNETEFVDRVEPDTKPPQNS